MENNDDDGSILAAEIKVNSDLGDLGVQLSGPPAPTSDWAWASDAAHEMLIHWLCPCCHTFNELSREEQLRSRRIRYNPFYYVCAYLPTVLSLYVGLKVHMLMGQSGPVGAEETRVEYEARVHWIYCTSGAMVAVAATDLLEAIYYTIQQKFFEVYIGILISLVICIAFVGGNHMFLWMMVRRSLVGVRSIIMCNLMFSVSMLSDLVLLVCEYKWSKENVEKEHGFALVMLIFKLLERLACVAFFVVATFIYARLWSLYRYDGRSLGRRLCQILPALVAACAISGLMLFGLLYNDGEYSSYIWDNFTRRR